MPKFTCTCGNALDLSDVWPEYEWRLVPMTRIGEIADRLDAGKLPGEDDFYDLVGKTGTTVYRCPACGRLHLETGLDTFDTYSRELSS